MRVMLQFSARLPDAAIGLPPMFAHIFANLPQHFSRLAIQLFLFSQEK